MNAEKAIRNKVIEKANEISATISSINGANTDGLPDTKDLKNLLDEKLAKSKEVTR